jgi:hypothetical protein
MNLGYINMRAYARRGIYAMTDMADLSQKWNRGTSRYAKPWSGLKFKYLFM